MGQPRHGGPRSPSGIRVRYVSPVRPDDAAAAAAAAAYKLSHIIMDFEKNNYPFKD